MDSTINPCARDTRSRSFNLKHALWGSNAHFTVNKSVICWPGFTWRQCQSDASICPNYNSKYKPEWMNECLRQINCKRILSHDLLKRKFSYSYFQQLIFTLNSHINNISFQEKEKLFYWFDMWIRIIAKNSFSEWPLHFSVITLHR